jgi:transglutaminase-like putative cysteine protease
MHRKITIITFILGLVAGFSLLALPVQASAEFGVDYITEYRLDASGGATVTHEIGLTNKLSTVYATSFSLDIGLSDVTGVLVRDAGGVITPKISQGMGQSMISFDFIDKVVGKNKTNNFSVSYRTQEIVVRNGSVWEVNIPRLEGEHAASSYLITLVVPSEFGEPAFISPLPISKEASATGVVYKFSPSVGFQAPVTAVFGQQQFMEFLLRYHLENTQPVESEATIALPPNTAYQQIAFKQIEPRPKQVEMDADGNWLASYRLAPGQLLSVMAVGVVKLEFEPKYDLGLGSDLGEYLQATEFWQADDPEIVALANKLKTPKAIYQYVVETLNYSYDKVNQGGGRAGAIGALENPDLAICTEFTDLFIALSRAAGVPARELEGYAFTTNDRLRPLSLTQDVLHAWPEYFDEQRQVWIQVDPTWGKTTGGIDYFNKLDLNHFVFVVHGRDPMKPAPAGAYKLKSDPKKDVEVYATSAVAWPSFDLAFSLADSDPKKPALVVRNVGQVAASGEIELKSDPPGIIKTTIQLQPLPPYGHRIIPLDPDLPWSLKPVNFNLSINDGQRQVSLGISAQRTPPTSIKVGLIAGLVFLAVVAYYSRRIHFRRQRGNQPLHW